MKRKSQPAIKIVAFFCLLSLTAIAACKGSDSREKVDDVVEEVTGKKDVERMQRMKKDIEKIKKNQQNRYDQLDSEEDSTN